MEERVARLETHVEHIRNDLTDVKVHVRELDHKVDSFRLAMEKSFLRATVWALGLYFTLAAALLGVMARGFGWIP